MSLVDRAVRFDQLMLDAKFQVEFWSKLAKQEGISEGMKQWAEGQVYVWQKVLWYHPDHDKMQCEQTASEVEKI